MNRFLLILVLTLCSLGSFAQAKTENLDSLIDDILLTDREFEPLFTPDKSFHYLYLNANGNSATTYAGREIGDNQLNGSAQLFYFNSWGLSLGLAGQMYADASPSYSSTVASVGYGLSPKFARGLYLRASYDRYFYASSDYVPTYNSAANLGASYRYKNFASSLDASMLMGTETGFHFTWTNYAKFKLWNFKGGYLRVRPGVQLYFGQEDVEYAQTTALAGSWGSVFTEYVTQKELGLMNVQLRLPIELSYKGFDISVGYYYNIPRSLDSYYSYDKSSYFGISIGYLLPLQK
ncbi:MAG: hypothetical protein RIS47_845 [Bacteroidota bacterium]